MQTAMYDVRSGNEDLKQSVAVLLSRLDNLTISSPPHSAHNLNQSRQQSRYEKLDAAKTRPPRRLRADPWNLGPVWSALGVQGRGVPTSQAHWQDHHMSFAISAPLAQLIGNYTLGLSVNVRTYTSNPWSFQILRGSRLDVSRILPSSHPFLDACRRGDVGDIRQHLLSGQGRLSDRDEKNWTPLAVSMTKFRESILAHCSSTECHQQWKHGSSRGASGARSRCRRNCWPASNNTAAVGFVAQEFGHHQTSPAPTCIPGSYEHARLEHSILPVGSTAVGRAVHDGVPEYPRRRLIFRPRHRGCTELDCSG